VKGGVPRGGCADWAVTRKKGWVQLSRAEEPEDRHWTVTVVEPD
jgi:hypothetical protein